METKNKKKQTTDMIGHENEQSSHQQIVKIDYALYEQYLKNSDLTEAEKQEFLDALWSIIVNFVDLGFGVHPLQQACEQNDEILASITAEMIRSEKPKKNL